jgi:hypothetical protein
MSWKCEALIVLTAVKSAKLVACLLRIVHALEERLDTSIILAPEVVGDWAVVLALSLLNAQLHRMMRRYIQERATAGASVVGPGIAPDGARAERSRG